MVVYDIEKGSNYRINHERVYLDSNDYDANPEIPKNLSKLLLLFFQYCGVFTIKPICEV